MKDFVSIRELMMYYTYSDNKVMIIRNMDGFITDVVHEEVDHFFDDFSKIWKLILYPSNDIPKEIDNKIKPFETESEHSLRPSVWTPEAMIIAIKNHVDVFNLIEKGYAVSVYEFNKNPYKNEK